MNDKYNQFIDLHLRSLRLVTLNAASGWIIFGSLPEPLAATGADQSWCGSRLFFCRHARLQPTVQSCTNSLFFPTILLFGGVSISLLGLQSFRF